MNMINVDQMSTYWESTLTLITHFEQQESDRVRDKENLERHKGSNTRKHYNGLLVTVRTKHVI